VTVGTPDTDLGATPVSSHTASKRPRTSRQLARKPTRRWQAPREPHSPGLLQGYGTNLRSTPTALSGIHEGAGLVKRRCLGFFGCPGAAKKPDGRVGGSTLLFGSGDDDAPWLIRTRLSPAPTPMWGEAVRCLGIHPPRTRWWAWSGTATATAGLIHIRRPAPRVGSCLISSSQPSPCPNLTPPSPGSGSHRRASRRTPR
jgi:hypothetical protein